jgi:hypothetical protein
MGRKFTCKQMIDALENTKGMVYLASQELGCSYKTVYNYIKAFPSVKVAYDTFNKRMGDIAEQKLFGLIEEGDIRAINFYLSTKGKDRGYTKHETLDITSQGQALGTPLADAFKLALEKAYGSDS